MNQIQNLKKVIETLSFYYNKNTKNIKIKNYTNFTQISLSLASLLTIYKKSKKTVYNSLVIVKPILIISYS